jgi:hypothetical protein
LFHRKLNLCFKNTNQLKLFCPTFSSKTFCKPWVQVLCDTVQSHSLWWHGSVEEVYWSIWKYPGENGMSVVVLYRVSYFKGHCESHHSLSGSLTTEIPILNHFPLLCDPVLYLICRVTHWLLASEKIGLHIDFWKKL